MLYESSNMLAVSGGGNSSRSYNDPRPQDGAVTPPTEKPVLDIDWSLDGDDFVITGTTDLGYDAEGYGSVTFDFPSGGLDSISFGLNQGGYSGSVTWDPSGGFTGGFSGEFGNGVGITAEFSLGDSGASATVTFDFIF